MTRHLSEDQLISYIHRTLADVQRETMDVHLRTCQDCRARLSGHETLGRRIQYSVMDWRRGVSPSPQMTFAAVAPKIRRSRQFATFWVGSIQLVYGAATLVVVVALVVGLALYFQDIGQSEETMFRGGPQRTGVYDVKGPKRGELLWRFTTGGVMGTAPTVIDGVAYVGGADGHLYAVDTQTLQEKWKFDAGRTVISTPAVADGTIYFGSGCIGGAPQGCGDPPGSDYYFYALDLQTGQEKWRFETSGAVVSSPLFADGVVYFGSEDQHLYALDGQTGRERWRFKAEDAMWSSPALADGVVYIGDGCQKCGSTGNRHLYAIDSQTGQELWRFETGSAVSGAPAISDGIVYAASKDQHLYAIDSQTGGELWKFETGGPLLSGPAVADGVVYIGSVDRFFYAVEGQTGEELWRFQSWGCDSSPVIGDGAVYFTGIDSNIYAIGDPQ